VPSYNYYTDAEQAEAEWVDRFPDWAFGYAQWREQPPLDDWRGPSIYDWFGERIEPPAKPPPQLDCPRLFVSHRKCDQELALRIAWLAAQEGWDYWVDVLDPNLAALRRKQNVQSLTPAQVTLATAAIVEFALLNCSHLIAVMTEQTRGSMWVPYEYGRVKEPAPFTMQVSCWRHPDLKADDCPEYLVLGKTLLNEEQIRGWLRWELERWRKAKHPTRCTQGANAPWHGKEPEVLPSEDPDREADARLRKAREPLANQRIDVDSFPGYVVVGNVRVPIRDYVDEE
jgi:hypothetical protein